MKRWLLLLIAVLSMGTSPDWVDQSTVTPYVRLFLRDTDGTSRTTGQFRAYIAGADTSVSRNHFDLTVNATAGYWYATAMANGAWIRSGWFDVYEIGGADSLWIDNQFLLATDLPKYAVDDTALATGSVDARVIAANAVNSSEIADGSVGGAEIASEAVGHDEIAANAVDSTNVVDGGLAPGDISVDGAATNDVLTWDGSNVIWTTAPAAGGVADSAVTSAKILSNAVTSAKIAANAVGAQEIATDAVGSAEIAADAVGSSEIATDAVGTAEIATDGVGSAEIQTDAVGSGEILADAVTAAELADSAVTTAHILANAVTASRIAADAVATQEIAANGVDRAELADDAAGASEIDWGEVMSGIRKRPLLWEEWYASANNDPWTTTAIASGTVAAVAGEASHPGILRISSSASASSGRIVSLAANLVPILITGGEVFEATFKLANLTNCAYYLGFLDATNTDAVDGAYIYIPSSGAAVGKTSSNSVRTSTGTTYTVSTSTWYRARITVNSNATSVTFEIFDDSGTQLWTNTSASNIPTAAGRETGAGFSAAYSTGGVQSLLDIDWLALWYDGRSLTR